jgi:DNA-binding NarL/FixJ family response regulator
MSTPIQISLVEDNEGLRSSLVQLINSSSGFRCLEAYPDAETALRNIPQRKPDIVLMDINLPKMSGIECVHQLKTLVPELPILMLTVYDDGDALFQSLTAGASGYLLKRTPKAQLLEAIREIYHGGAPMSRQIARKVVQYFHEISQAPKPAEPAPQVEGLTPREHEILANLAKGFTYKEIANQLNISNDTVRNHMRNIYEKLHVHTRTQAILKFLGK